MRNSFCRYSSYVFGLFVFIIALSVTPLVDDGGLTGPGRAEAKVIQETVLPDQAKGQPPIENVIDVQDRHTPDLMAIPEVVGTAVGLADDGTPAVLVFTKSMVEAGVIPGSLEGTPVVVKVTGEIFSMKPPPGKGGGKNNIDPTARFKRPVPIGVSTGNEGECSAGTIGARVTDGVDVFALSNNHVYALENNAAIGSKALQPGRFDTDCNIDPNDEIGTLANFIEIVFSTTASNTIDAAIASSSTVEVGNSTPSDGYGIPESITVAATIGLAVQKYGRTTALTKGVVTAINAILNINYSSGTARFVKQTIVESAKPFIKAGDSGSLLVSDPGRNPVGLLFAGSRSGKFAVANPISDVLNAFSVSVDDGA